MGNLYHELYSADWLEHGIQLLPADGVCARPSPTGASSVCDIEDFISVPHVPAVFDDVFDPFVGSPSPTMFEWPDLECSLSRPLAPPYSDSSFDNLSFVDPGSTSPMVPTQQGHSGSTFNIPDTFHQFLSDSLVPYPLPVQPHAQAPPTFTIPQQAFNWAYAGLDAQSAPFGGHGSQAMDAGQSELVQMPEVFPANVGLQPPTSDRAVRDLAEHLESALVLGNAHAEHGQSTQDVYECAGGVKRQTGLSRLGRKMRGSNAPYNPARTCGKWRHQDAEEVENGTRGEKKLGLMRGSGRRITRAEYVAGRYDAAQCAWRPIINKDSNEYRFTRWRDINEIKGSFRKLVRDGVTAVKWRCPVCITRTFLREDNFMDHTEKSACRDSGMFKTKVIDTEGNMIVDHWEHMEGEEEWLKPNGCSHRVHWLDME